MTPNFCLKTSSGEENVNGDVNSPNPVLTLRGMLKNETLETGEAI